MCHVDINENKWNKPKFLLMFENKIKFKKYTDPILWLGSLCLEIPTYYQHNINIGNK